ncbi:MAG: tetratricopeptide repeat protein [Mariprofundales bacterium]
MPMQTEKIDKIEEPKKHSGKVIVLVMLSIAIGLTSWLSYMRYDVEQEQLVTFKEAAEDLPHLIKLAENGDVDAKYQLGLLYGRGIGVDIDYEKALALFFDAAMHGHVKSQFYTGSMFMSGEGTEKDIVEAYAWFWVASSNKDYPSKRFYRALTSELSPRQYQQAEDRMHELWKATPHIMKKEKK